jgi:capsular polysaccharide biosynthesis protein
VMLRKVTTDKLDKLKAESKLKQAAIDDTIKRNRPDLAGILNIDLAALEHERQRVEEQLLRIATSRDAIASQIAAAGLDMSLSIVEEHRPERPTRSNFVLVMIAVVVGTGSLVGGALVLGAFDSRVHDSDDVARLGLPVLGHVPGFAGDNVGSMQTRSAVRRRVPSFLRWRSHR